MNLEEKQKGTLKKRLNRTGKESSLKSITKP